MFFFVFQTFVPYIKFPVTLTEVTIYTRTNDDLLLNSEYSEELIPKHGFNETRIL